ncbi:putative membrane protein [Anaplasma phagocytophilum str. ApNP]|uniref:Putative membrane protein n=1 Tax=Anaplasma phagocytophilum str. ApNP TaxID=1359153 RepID=A0A0F3NIU3_ANAPH|nr:putative membrane protein [Anaplasma phagocytophilum str. ApNP]
MISDYHTIFALCLTSLMKIHLVMAPTLLLLALMKLAMAQ